MKQKNHIRITIERPDFADPLWGLDSDIWLEWDMESHMTHMTRLSVIISNVALASFEYYP